MEVNHVRKTMEILSESEYYAIVNEKDGRLYRVHLKTKNCEQVSQKVLTTVLGHPGGKRQNWEILPARMDYRPDVFKIRFFDHENGMTVLNKYVPPIFMERDFWNPELEITDLKYDKTSKTLNDLADMPKCYVDYLSHLCNADNDSLQYLLDWLAVAVDPTVRNITSLVLISPEGIGKGVFYDYLLTPLFGQRNVVQVKGKDALESRFNSQFLHKQIIFFDEVEVKTTAAINRFKVLANPKLEIEQKGMDPFEAKNWANTILASNDLDAINVTAGNRRYSIIHTSDTRLDKMCEESNYKTVNALLSEIIDIKNIERLYLWLIGHQPARNMNYAFTSDRKATEIKEASLAEWELQTLQFLTDRFYAVNPKDTQDPAYVSLEHVQVNLKDQNSRVVPGRKIMDRLAKKFPNLVKMKWDKTIRKYFFEVQAPYAPQVDAESGRYIAQPGSF